MKAAIDSKTNLTARNRHMEAPKALQEAALYFSDFENCKSFMVNLRWPDGTVKCPRCASSDVFWIEKECVWKCHGGHVRAKFSLKSGTVMEDSPISVDKWLTALWMVVNCKKRMSSCETARHLGVTQKSAWFMNHRIRMALYSGSIEKMSGPVEADETFIWWQSVEHACRTAPTWNHRNRDKDKNGRYGYSRMQ